MHIFKRLFILSFSLLLLSCADYQAGYTDGYANNQHRKWLVFGKDEYNNGFNAGQAEKFQQDWLAENPIEEDAMQCRDIVVNIDTDVFLSNEFSPVMSEIYTR